MSENNSTLSMHAKYDPRLIKCYDGLNYSFRLLEYNYSDLHKTCLNILTDHSMIIPALSQSWMIVDLVHRIREIAQEIPGFSKRSPELIQFLQKTEIAERFRHYIQHLRQNLLKTDIDPTPVWGTLSWIDKDVETKSHTVVVGASFEGASYTSSIWDTLENRWVSKVSLTAESLTFNFDIVFEQCERFREFIMPWITKTYSRDVRFNSKPYMFTVVSCPYSEVGKDQCSVPQPE